MRSMILIPVSVSWGCVSCSSKVGGGRWIGQRSSASTAPRLSSGRPSTSKRRPSVFGPTGTAIRWSVSTPGTSPGRPSASAIVSVRPPLVPRRLRPACRAVLVYLDGVVDGRQLVGRELHVHHRADDLHHRAFSALRHCLPPRSNREQETG